MLFDIRAELPDQVLWDFKVPAEPRDNDTGTKTAAFHVAREAAETKIKAEVGQNARIEWRGMIAFVNRGVPCDGQSVIATQLARWKAGPKAKP